MTTPMRTEAVAAADAGQRFLDLGLAAALAQAACLAKMTETL